MRLLVTGGSGFIGTNFMDLYIPQGIPLLNIDWNPPLNKAQAPYWKEVDLMDADALERAFEEF
ncbi:MAG: NAD-dependent epimerase/dehydratase family protein, partial [Flavobacteriales bacterium]